MSRLTVPVRRLPHGADLPLPGYATAGSAGLDLLAAVEGEVTLAPGERRLIPTGLAVALPPDFEAQVRPRSGLALRHGVTVLNTPGTIDADYRGEIGVILANLGAEPFTLSRGTRIAQMVVAPCRRIAWRPVAALDVAALDEPALDKRVRGAGGFGSTGLAGGEGGPPPDGAG